MDSREMTLKEWVGKLLKHHRAHREYDELIADNDELRKCHEAELGVCQQHCDVVKQLQAELAESKKENEQLKKKMGAAGVLQQIADKLKSLTGEQNVWKAITILEQALKDKDV